MHDLSSEFRASLPQWLVDELPTITADGPLETPEERMACCEDGRNCPMHSRETDDSGSGKVLTQVEADSCCLVSERRNSTDTPIPTFAAALSFAVIVSRASSRDRRRR